MNEHLTDERLAELRTIAEATPRQEWFVRAVRDRHFVCSLSGMERALCGYGPMGSSAQLEAEHIAAFDPPTVLALLDEVERLQALRGEQ